MNRKHVICLVCVLLAGLADVVTPLLRAGRVSFTPAELLADGLCAGLVGLACYLGTRRQPTPVPQRVLARPYRRR